MGPDKGPRAWSRATAAWEPVRRTTRYAAPPTAAARCRPPARPASARLCGEPHPAAQGPPGEVNTQHRPAAGDGLPAQLAVGVHRERVADRLEHVDVGGRVAVGVAARRGRSGARRPAVRGRRPCWRRRVVVDLAGVAAVDDLHLGGDDPVGPEHLPDRLDDLGARGGHDDHVAARQVVLLDQRRRPPRRPAGPRRCAASPRRCRGPSGRPTPRTAPRGTAASSPSGRGPRRPRGRRTGRRRSAARPRREISPPAWKGLLNASVLDLAMIVLSRSKNAAGRPVARSPGAAGPVMAASSRSSGCQRSGCDMG